MKLYSYSTDINIVDQGIRPIRIPVDEHLYISDGTKQIIFGSTDRDYIEVFLYDLFDQLVYSINVPATSAGLILTTIVDTSGAYEVLNIDLNFILSPLNVVSGRYTIAINFFRKEVGEFNLNPLTITEISPDGTEIGLTPAQPTTEIQNQLYEWITPSVPKLYAQALIDQTTGLSTDFTSIDSVDINDILNKISTDVVARLSAVSAISGLSNNVEFLLRRIRDIIVDRLVTTKSLYAVQQAELNELIVNAIKTSIHELKTSGLVDNRLELL